jgi:hypothetical protein
MSCENTIFRNISKFNEFLHNNNIPDDQIAELIKKYKKILENKNILKSDKFKEKIKSYKSELDESKIDILDEDIDKLKDFYEEQLQLNNLYNNNNYEYDSILFLSKLNDKMFSSFKIKSCFKQKILNVNKCIDHLKETERMRIVKYDETLDFLDNYNIYYDDDEHLNNPKKDVLYIKVNNNYYVTNNDYFEKCTDFYFKLYSNIFAIFNLKKITLKYHNNEIKMSDIHSGVNSGPVNINGRIKSKNIRNNDNAIVMRFNKNIQRKDNHICFNGCIDEEA